MYIRLEVNQTDRKLITVTVKYNLAMCMRIPNLFFCRLQVRTDRQASMFSRGKVSQCICGSRRSWSLGAVLHETVERQIYLDSSKSLPTLFISERS